MSVLTKLQEDMKIALKAGEKDRLQVIRMLLSDVKNIDLAPKKITEEEAVAAYAKKLKKSAEEYEKIGRQAEVDKLKSELAIVESYLPKKASAEETDKLVEAFLAANAFTEKQMGQAMGMFMKQHGQNVDPGLANAAIKKGLAGK
ncbi:MAG TPA: GatB/YqeY domain-containing protein [Tepidisphaeraceae bacterium]|nr:GatB/YqeY domain-containing protein [Tepidisphaeraceae bacterium]